MAKPVLELMVLYEKSLVRLAEHEESLDASKDDIDDLKTRLFVPKMEPYVAEVFKPHQLC